MKHRSQKKEKRKFFFRFWFHDPMMVVALMPRPFVLRTSDSYRQHTATTMVREAHVLLSIDALYCSYLVAYT
jgi:hypothetical protein